MTALVSLKKYILPLAVAAWAWLAPVHPVLAAVTALPFVDLFLALVVAFRVKRPKGMRESLRVIESRGLQQTTWKIIRYCFAIILAYVTEKYLTGPGVPFVRIIAGFIGATELKSCLEHLDGIGGPPVFASILSKIAPPTPPDNGGSK